jgi:hypothetical protein
VLLCEALESVREDPAIAAFEHLFRERGLPAEVEAEVAPVWWSLSSFSRRSLNASHSSALLA